MCVGGILYLLIRANEPVACRTRIGNSHRRSIFRELRCIVKKLISIMEMEQSEARLFRNSMELFNLEKMDNTGVLLLLAFLLI